MTLRTRGSTAVTVPVSPRTASAICCPSCGAQSLGDALHCLYCDAWLAPTARCGRCAGVFFTRIESCSSCGANLEAAQPLSLLPSLPPRRRWSRGRILLILTAIAPVLSLLLVLLATTHLTLWNEEGGVLGLLLLLVCLAGGIALFGWSARVGRGEGSADPMAVSGPPAGGNPWSQ